MYDIDSYYCDNWRGSIEDHSGMKKLNESCMKKINDSCMKKFNDSCIKPLNDSCMKTLAKFKHP